jgi:hypothetical protein
VDVDNVGRLSSAKLGDVMAMLGAEQSEKQLAKLVDTLGADADGLCLGADFIRHQQKSSPTQAVPTAIFFLQTLGLLMKSSNFFQATSVLNLDAEEVVGACTSPLGTRDKFVAKVMAMPLSIMLGVLLAVPIWNLLRRKLPKSLWEKIGGAPPRVTATHFRRTMVGPVVAIGYGRSFRVRMLSGSDTRTSRGTRSTATSSSSCH